MSALNETTMIIGMFLLRLGIPLAVITLVSYWLNRLDIRWAAEASAYQRAQQWNAHAAVANTAQPPLLQPPCWAQRGCSDTQRAHCAAGQQPCLPCWLARMRSEGQLPTACARCAIFALPLTAAPAPATMNAGDD
jgi:hypothetical protein